ncbi:CBO0543 family protein [Domibacillus indicus]|uniref:CBO0543 family protein n=1 Tax=Domibacillus indicus TaxID=1437523 RepID=UPI000617AD4B|nr:CBO0543 family protein [Domibacillus indicus]
MYFSIVFLVVPWVIALLHLQRKDKTLIPLIAPFSSVNAFLVNGLGVQFGFWHVYPFIRREFFSTISFDLGLYPVLGCYMIYFIKQSRRNPYFIVVLMAFLTALMEFFFLLMGKVAYGNGWNVIWTFVSYFFPYLFGYWFYRYLQNIKVIN